MSSGNYACTDLNRRADDAAYMFRDHLAQLDKLYALRQKWRNDNGIRVTAWCGHGRAGKDTGAEYFCHETDLVYPGSCSSLMKPLVAEAAGVTEEEAWQQRHDHRKFWVEFCNAFRRKDPTRLLRMTLAEGDVSVGVRGRLELEAGLRTGVLDCAIWVDNSRVQADFTVEYTPQDCDLVIPNHGGILEFYRKINRLISTTRAGDYRVRLRAGDTTPFGEVK